MEQFYFQVMKILQTMPAFKYWPEACNFLGRAAAKEMRDWRLPILAGEAMGGTAEQAASAVTAIASAQLSIILIDDLLDNDPRGEYQQIGQPATANLAAALQAAAIEVIARDELLSEASVRLAVISSLNRMILATAHGQYLDTQNLTEEASYWRVVESKSAPFFGAALHVGALTAGASAQAAEGLRRFGCLYGEMIQIHDDLNDCMASPANPDWTEGRWPLPILFAQTADHPERERFLQLRTAVLNPEALAEAQAILVRCGAVSYCVYHLLHRYRQAQAVLNGVPMANRSGLENLLGNLVSPVWELFRAAGVAQPELITAV
jgi:octaprenyl-diphosphate synthase